MRNFFFKNWKTFIIYLFYPFINLFAISSFNPSRHPRTPPASMGATTPPCIFPSYSSSSSPNPRSTTPWTSIPLSPTDTSTTNCPKNLTPSALCIPPSTPSHIPANALYLPLKSLKLPWPQCNLPFPWEQYRLDLCGCWWAFSWRKRSALQGLNARGHHLQSWTFWWGGEVLKVLCQPLIVFRGVFLRWI